MAISKITLNGVVQIDLTADTVTAQTLLDDYVAHGNDGNTVTGELVMPTARTASDVTVLGATVTVPAGAYSSQVQKSIANATYSAVVDNDFTTHSGQRKWVNTGWVGIESGGYVESNEVISVVDTTYNAVPANTTITPTTSAQTIGGANYMMEGAVTVSAMPTGTAGTPSASKGTVSNHAVTVTPSVTNSTGYITGGTKTGTGVSVSASELVSGTLNITSSGTKDVTNYASASVSAGTEGTPTATKGTVSNHSVSVTPSVTNSAGYISGSTKTGTAVTVTASELASGNKSITENGTDIDVVGYSTVSVDVPTSPYTEADMKKMVERSTSFTSFTIPSDVTKIGPYAFAGCNRLNMSSLPSGVTVIDTYAFSNCIYLTLTSLPSGVTTIGERAFYWCTRLALSSLPNTITSIGNSAFYLCESMTLTSLPSGLTSISQYAFARCSNIALTSLPSGITNISTYAFSQCTNLALTSLPSGLTTIGSFAFEKCTSLALTTLPSSLTSIEGSAFNSCTSLTTITCNGALGSLSSAIFNSVGSSYPMQLREVHFPYMGSNSTSCTLSSAFGSTTAANACQQLEIVDAGSTTQVYSSAFANCYKLQTLVLRRSSAICTLYNINAFLNTPFRGYNNLTGTVYVPSALIATYQTANNWKTLYDAGTVSFVKIEGSVYEL